MARSISTTRKKVTSLRWTDHPLIDMGLTAVILESGKYAPEEVTEEDWQSVMKTVKRNYVNRNFEKSSGILFTYNAPFTNPSYSKKPEERKKAIDFAFAIATGKSDPLPENCYFFNDRPAWIRAARDQVPLLMGREQINFYATGTSELPLSDIAYGCLLALPLATPIISGKMAILKTDDPELLLEIADKWKGELDREYAKKELSDRKGIRTRITETLDSIFELYTKKKKKVAKTTKNQIVNEKYYGGLSVYHLSNSGNGPGIQIYHYQPFSLKFLKRANMGAYHFAWKAFTGAFWLSPSGKTGGSEPSKEDRPVRKNIVMERMTAGPEEAKTIIQFFLRYARNRAGILSNLRVSDIDLWPNTSSLVELFLMEIYVMKLERIEKIKKLADTLADEIDSNKDSTLFKNIMGISSVRNSYYNFRNILIRAIRARLKRTGSLLLNTDDYLSIFESTEELPDSGWSLARDLLRLRCLEELHRKNYFKKDPDALVGSTEEEVENEENLEEK